VRVPRGLLFHVRMLQFDLLFFFLPMISVSTNKGLCDSSSASSSSWLSSREEESLTVSISPNTKLYGESGSKHSVPVLIRNDDEDPVSLLVSFTETFPVYNLNTFTTHVELVRDISARKVYLPSNETREVLVNFHISHYVPPRFRSKVTVIAKELFSNQGRAGNTRLRGEVSFFFTVVGQHEVLTNYDSVPPSCLGMDRCPDYGECSQLTGDSCDLGTWTSQFLVQDGGAGLGWQIPVWPSQAELLEGIPYQVCLGTNEKQVVTVQSSCCYPGISLQVADLAGNLATCDLGEVPSQKGPRVGALSALFIISLAVMLSL